MEPVCLADFEEYARNRMQKYAFEYIAGGAMEENSKKENVEAFRRLKIRPRVLRGIPQVNMSTTILGQEISMPICIAPTAVHKMAHPEGETATARAAAKADTCFVMSCAGSLPLEDVASAVPDALKWMLMYVLDSAELMTHLVRRAEEAGYKAIVISVDAPVKGRRLCDLRNMPVLEPHFSDFPNLRRRDVEKDGEQTGEQKEGGLATKAFGYSSISSCVSFDTIDWLKTITKLPIILKGILTAEDATIAIEHGVDGIIVSNHGGRQLDCVPATIEVLSEIVEAVRGKAEVYVDGGVRLGTDVLKALALGARAVFIGRPIMWGLAYKGEEGVSKVLELLREEFRIAMMLSGCASLADIKPSHIMKTTA